jgi:recombination associated protein RdgC
MEFRNVRLPKTAGTESEESGNREEVEGMILERLFLYEDLVQTVNALFRQFLERRTSDEWSSELDKVRTWVVDNRHIVS